MKFLPSALHPLFRLPIENHATSAARRTDAVPTALTFEQIYTDHFRDVSRWARALGGLDADLDDITQEVFLIVQRKLAEFDGRNLNAWLYSIVRRQVSDYRRSAWMRRFFHRSRQTDENSQPLLINDGPDPSQAFERRESQQMLVKILNRMSAVQRTAFILFEIEAYSGEEIAELEGIPLNTVWTRLHHARKRFLELIDELRAEGRLP